MMLGNLTVTQIEARMGISFPDETKNFLNESHQAEAKNISKGKWHCFDLPFFMLCGDMETASKVYDCLKDKTAEIKEFFQIGLER